MAKQSPKATTESLRPIIEDMAMDEKIVEAVARAIAGPSFDDPNVQCEEGQYYRDRARDAIAAYEAARPDHVMVPKNPSLNSKMADVLGTITMVPGNVVHISGEDVIKTGMWRAMITAHEQEKTDELP